MPTLWFRIVSMFPSGPTIPFILGATRFPVGEPPASRGAGQTELRALLETMARDARAGYGVRIERCPGLNALIAKASPDGELTWDHNEVDATTIDALSAKLWDVYGDVISRGEYSKDGWHRFTEDELTKIKDVREESVPKP